MPKKEEKLTDGQFLERIQKNTIVIMNITGWIIS